MESLIQKQRSASLWVMGKKRKALRLCTWEIIFSWDVVFNEEEYGGLESDDTTRYVELELPSDYDPPTTLKSPQVEPQPEEVNHRDIYGLIVHTMSLHHLNQWFVDQHD